MNFSLVDGQGEPFYDRFVTDADFQVLDDEMAHLV
jgi:hypothetical protein